MALTVETELLDRAREGDTRAYEALQVLLEDALRGYIQHLLGRHDAEDDIVQNTFFALYQNLERLESIDNVRAFCFRVVRNQCYDIFRRRSRHDVISLEVAEIYHKPHKFEAILTDEQPLPDETTHWRLIYDRVMQAMEKLPEAQRLSLILFTHEQLTYQEIADALNISIGTVKSRIYHAKLGLKRLLDPDILEALGIDI